MSGIPISKSGPKQSLNQIATATGSEIDKLAGRKLQRDSSTLSTSSIPVSKHPEVFKVGDRVWVGGTKQGTVRYIGQTKFINFHIYFGPRLTINQKFYYFPLKSFLPLQ
ncbi:CAP-Gly domain-containing linker protein 2 [Eurytemora carolleeae]|uniref:CAP-Gly domain-containing linker protein 2 n=1 Tax=Eurytemora carolleeae TaxID=1294199 RepID=UPI000C7685BF|nr:CAP-Gly domain-containing linker protein 2 [Eurytemora carolleeae]|eukprot:XP_023342292.1 CAP-Gly domain-containing linker protein 2-like [Eurytemora affinis]